MVAIEVIYPPESDNPKIPKSYCTGSITSNRKILTAAHCLEGAVEVNIRVSTMNAFEGTPIKIRKDQITIYYGSKGHYYWIQSRP